MLNKCIAKSVKFTSLENYHVYGIIIVVHIDVYMHVCNV